MYRQVCVEVFAHKLLNKLPADCCSSYGMLRFIVAEKQQQKSSRAACLFWAECLTAPEFACRYKQAFQQPYAATAALNYYRAYVDVVTTRPSPAFHRSESQPCIMPLQDWAVFTAPLCCVRALFGAFPGTVMALMQHPKQRGQHHLT